MMHIILSINSLKPLINLINQSIHIILLMKLIILLEICILILLKIKVIDFIKFTIICKKIFKKIIKQEWCLLVQHQPLINHLN